MNVFSSNFVLIFSCSFFGLSCFCVGVGCGSNHAVQVVLCRWGGSIFFGGNVVCGIICARGETNVFRLESACLTGWHMFLSQFLLGTFFIIFSGEILRSAFHQSETGIQQKCPGTQDLLVVVGQGVIASRPIAVQGWCPQYDPLAVGRPRKFPMCWAWNVPMVRRGNQSLSSLRI